ncbi:PAS domain-containing protein [Streptomyces sp. TLI_171]|uniref:response regulator n=1 Tax=Streptomyces sp. TLI_171 TaxID=1938859 RepID=UPI000C1850C7|nr:PAS domain-containing protein [Streptomyces sp. TLI_171]RKE20139.1 PAS domain S-box-containing protein [Streptomyces sp. TLI_171]
MSSRPTRGAARLAAILDALPDPLLLVNSNGTVVDVNKAAVESLQAPGTSLVGMGVLDLLPEFDPSRIPGSMRPPASETESLDRPVTMTARRTDGTAFTVEVSGNDFTDEGGGEAHGFLSFTTSDQDLLLLLVRDMSARLGVESELRRQHKQTEMILRAAAEGVLGVDLEGRVVLVNPAAAHILDFRASELGGRELHPLIQHSQPDGSPLAAESSALVDTLHSGRKHRIRNTVLWRKDGTPVTVDLTTAPVRDGEQLVGAVMTFTDRTHELALAARNEHLTAVLESELGGALTALHRRIDTLAADPAGQLWPEANWTLRRLAEECRRFGRLIDGVLEHQRFEADADRGKAALDRERIGLDEVVQLAVDRAGELVGPGRVRYSVHAAAVKVLADRERLARALAHLVADVSGVTSVPEPAAAESDPAAPGDPFAGPAPVGEQPPMVVLAAAQRGDVARIEVRGPARTSSAVHLPIARAAVQRHGGVLQRHDLPGGAGATYVVELPLDPDGDASGGPERQQHVPKDSDTAMLPDLPGQPGAPELRPAAADGASAAEPAGGATARADDTQGHGRRRARAARADDSWGNGPDRPAGQPEQQAPRAPIALGPGPSASAEPAVTAPADGAAAAEPAAEAGGRTGRRARRAATAQAATDSSASLHIPGIPDPGTAVYPGLEHSLPVTPAEPPAAPAAQPTGRRRRLALPADVAESAEEVTAILPPVRAEAPAEPAPESSPEPSSALEVARPAAPAPAAPVENAQPQPVGSGLGELVPPRPLGGFQAAFPAAFPAGGAQAELPAGPDSAAAGAGGAVNGQALNGQGVNGQALNGQGVNGQGVNGHELNGQAVQAGSGESGGPGAALALPAGPGAVEGRTPPRPVAELAPAKEQPQDGPRSLLVWPEPDPSTRGALESRGFRPVVVASREEVDAQVPETPAALFVDPLTGPITRTALQSLRTAALAGRVPVLLAAGLGQATRDAAYGADPAVLLRALAPRDGENHAARVLLVESDPEVAAALVASLERRGMHVEHAADENDAVARASSIQPNLVVLDLQRIERQNLGLLDWLRANDRLHRTPLVVYTSADLDPQARAGLRTGANVLFLAERSTTEDVQGRIVELLARIGSLGQVATAGSGAF